MPDFAALAQTTITALLEPGEALRGVAAATHQKMFSGQLFAVATTDRRLILQPVDRKIAAKGPAIIFTPASLAAFKLDGAGDGWWTAPMAVLDASALTFEVQTNDGQKLKVMMMRGGGGLMGSLGGGEAQQQGVLALAEWLRDNTRR